MSNWWVAALGYAFLTSLLFVGTKGVPLTPTTSGRPAITAQMQPWCGACKRLKPEWQRLVQIGPPELSVVTIDCSQTDCKGVDHYPMITCKGQEYQGERRAEAMKQWALSL